VTLVAPANQVEQRKQKNPTGYINRDSDEALKLTLAYCVTGEMQQAAVRALEFKCEVLWATLDAIHGKCKSLTGACERD